MRGYREKMEQCRLPAPRVRELRAWCLTADAAGLAMIESAAAQACGDGLAPWIVRHVTVPRKGWPELRGENIPCSIDTFRVYRARFYALLDRMLKTQGENTPLGGIQAIRNGPPADIPPAIGSAQAG